MKIVLLLTTFLIFLPDFAEAQQRRLIDRAYADANLGVLLAGSESYFQVQAGLGYLITKKHGLGIGYRAEWAGSSSSSTQISGLSVNYRYAAPGGLIAKVGVGKLLAADAGENNFREFRFVEASVLTHLAVAYQLRGGFTCGLYYTYVPKVVFDAYLPAYELPPFPSDDDSPVYEKTVGRAYRCFGITVGYTLPKRQE